MINDSFGGVTIPVWILGLCHLLILPIIIQQGKHCPLNLIFLGTNQF